MYYALFDKQTGNYLHTGYNSTSREQLADEYAEYKKEGTEDEDADIIDNMSTNEVLAFAETDEFEIHEQETPFEDLDDSEQEETDLFTTPENLPTEVQEIINGYNGVFGYENCAKMLVQLQPLGYEFSWGLDGEPYSLTKIEQEEQEATKTVYNVTYYGKEGNEVDRTQIDEKNEELAWELFSEFGHKIEEGMYIEWEETTEELEQDKENDKLIERSNRASFNPPKVEQEKGVWDFVEEYHPYYHSSDEIMYSDDLQKMLDGEFEEGSGLHEKFKIEFHSDDDLVQNELHIVNAVIYEQAIENYIKIKGGL